VTNNKDLKYIYIAHIAFLSLFLYWNK